MMNSAKKLKETDDNNVNSRAYWPLARFTLTSIKPTKYSMIHKFFDAKIFF